MYKRDTSLKPYGYVDADFAGFVDNRRFTSGEIYFIGGGPVAWASHHDCTVALSTAESEYMAGARGAKQLQWLYSFMAKLNLHQPRPAILLCDNQSAIDLSKSTKNHSKIKHIDVRHHYLREHVEEGDLALKYVPSKDNLANIMTKPLASFHHKDLVE